MKKLFIFLKLLALLVTVTVAAFLYLQLSPKEDTAIQETLSPGEKMVSDIAKTIESPEPSVTIPQEVLEELEVSDLERREESIANTPDIWRAFISAEVNLSDPGFVFGCLQYLETGGRLILDVFYDEAGNAWVAEASEQELLGIGLLDAGYFEQFQAYYSVNPEAACLLVSRRNYLTYKLITTQVEVKKQFDSFTLMSGDNFIVLPEEFRNSFQEAKDAVLVGESVVYLGLDGVQVFDFYRWEASLVYEFLWKDLHGISDLVKNPENPNVAALAVQSWDEELAFVIVYGYSQREGLFEYGKGSYAIAWELGVNGVANLAFPEDLVFVKDQQLQITEYPEFNEKIVNGDYPPDAGKKLVDLWDY